MTYEMSTVITVMSNQTRSGWMGSSNKVTESYASAPARLEPSPMKTLSLRVTKSPWGCEERRRGAHGMPG